jgi:hypothetical protein
LQGIFWTVVGTLGGNEKGGQEFVQFVEHGYFIDE